MNLILSEKSDSRKKLIAKKDLLIYQRATEAVTLLEDCGYDIDEWLERQGFLLERLDVMPAGSEGEILGETIFIKRHREPLHELICAAHELGHCLIHSKCIGYRVTDKVLVKKSEREAETFAALIAFPSITHYDTEQEFVRESGLAPNTAKLRIDFWKRTGY